MRARDKVVCSMQPSSEYMQLHFSGHELFFVHLHFRFASIFAKSRVSRNIYSILRLEFNTCTYHTYYIDRVQHVYADFSITSVLLFFDTLRRPNSISSRCEFFSCLHVQRNTGVIFKNKPNVLGFRRGNIAAIPRLFVRRCR